jgi:hypothetical protein
MKRSSSNAYGSDGSAMLMFGKSLTKTESQIQTEAA